jgi:hypothetical protein
LAVRFTFLEAVYTILAAGGGLTALAADKLGMETLKEAGLAVFFLGILVFGLDMLVHRRAEIGTRYSSPVNPSFHVFRGRGAFGWGVVFVVTGLLVVGYVFISVTNWTSAREFFGEHTSIFVIFAGILVTAWGFGSATKATYRHGNAEQPARRLADRVAAIVLILPIGLVLLGWGLLKTFAPSVADGIASDLKATALRWLENLLN